MTKDRALDALLREGARAARESRRKVRQPLSYWQRHKSEKCSCLRYLFPHRRGGGACTHSPRHDYYVALRHAAAPAEAMQTLSVA